MKTRILMIFVALLAMAANAKAVNAIQIDNVTANAGTKVALPVSITNDFVATGLQFNLTLPEGVTIDCDNEDWNTTERTPGFTVMGNLSGGVYKFSLMSTTGKTITGNDGVILNINLKVDATVAPNDYILTITDAIMFEENSTEDHNLADATATLTVEAALAVEDFQFYTKNITVEKDVTEAVLDICFKNSESVKAFCFDIVLPEGVTPIFDEEEEDWFVYGDRFGGRNLTVEGETIGEVFHIDGVSTKTASNIAAGDDVALTVKLKIAASSGAYSLKLANQSATKADGTTVAAADFTAKLTIKGEATGINQIANGSVSEGKQYNINGQRVTDSFKGVVIQNGKKTIK